MKELEKYPKVKEAFLKWYSNNPYLPDYWILIRTPFSMQFGAWVDFCDSFSVNLDLQPVIAEYPLVYTVNIIVEKEILTGFDDCNLTRTEARQEAFKQSLTILNDKI